MKMVIYPHPHSLPSALHVTCPRCLQLADRVYLRQTVSTDHRPPSRCARLIVVNELLFGYVQPMCPDTSGGAVHAMHQGMYMCMYMYICSMSSQAALGPTALRQSGDHPLSCGGR